ncbi:hypothetical protein P152DRAFT_450491 [Eremomyces bilateralis CBS 781.70]|uniref:Uncharacterized protein n=1 Tax=Eremomyces bilateralis CBS 781.70 TaxID=1392243 RepID=A0A6G1FZY4_9PEZI|nr:uncharacterized protein P152DRAFT_450491 [Eremomyces bilateralis CBS 781.70]KAF1811364.1 hypothetical protein P152DRAFT_450491 [Eremomyces bilateralis CBS 781.70]
MSVMEEQQQYRPYYPSSQQQPPSQPPQSQPPPQQRPRAQSHFSFKSNKSGSSSTHGGAKSTKEHLRETDAEKRKNRISHTTKANPNAAMMEMQPVARALEASTLGALRTGTLKDIHGNVITDPDRSNPTRSRMERPLDTIRGFDEQIEKSWWDKRQSMYGSNGMFEPNGDTKTALRKGLGEPEANQTSIGYDQNNSGNNSRRNSQFGMDSYSRQPAYGSGYSTPGGYSNSNAGGYYRNRDSYYDSYSSPQQYNPPPRRHYPGHPTPRPYGDNGTSPHERTPEPALSRYNPAQGIYPNQGYHQSRDTVNTGASGSGSASGSQGLTSSELWPGSADTSIEDGSLGAAAAAKDSANMAPDPYSYDGVTPPQLRNPVDDQGFGTGWGYGSQGEQQPTPTPAVQSPYRDMSQQYNATNFPTDSGYGNSSYNHADQPPQPPPHHYQSQPASNYPSPPHQPYSNGNSNGSSNGGAIHLGGGNAYSGANNDAPPPPPPKSGRLQAVRSGASQGLQTSGSTKRKSWFKRRFSGKG